MSLFSKAARAFGPKSRERADPLLNIQLTPELRDKGLLIYKLLAAQKALFLKGGKLPELASSPKGIGYVFGFSDAGCQHLGISEDDSYGVTMLVLLLAFDDKQNVPKYLRQGVDAANDQSGPIFEGMMRGGQEFMSAMQAASTDTPPMGWFAIATGRA